MTPEELQPRIAVALIEAAQRFDWVSAAQDNRFTAGRVESDCLITLRDGTERWVSSPRDSAAAFRELRPIMATPEHGAWFSARATAVRGDTLRISYNYDERPAWDTEPDEASVVEDLEDNPRPWGEIPDWHPVRKKYDEQSWEAFRASKA